MNDCPDCQQRYCFILEGVRYCTNHCIRPFCYCIRCIIRNQIRTTEGELCRFCDKVACCYISVNTGVFQGQNSYRITRICSMHRPTSGCECLVCHKQHSPSTYETEVFTILISHPLLVVRDGYPEAQAYILEQYDPEGNKSREEELRQVTSESSDAGMVSVITEEAGSSERAAQAPKRSRGTWRGQVGNRRSSNARGGPSARKAGTDIPTDDACNTGMQQRKRNHRGRISISTPRPRNLRRKKSDGESQNRRRSVRSWKPDGTPTSDHRRNAIRDFDFTVTRHRDSTRGWFNFSRDP